MYKEMKSKKARMFFLPDVFIVKNCRIKKFLEIKEWVQIEVGIPMRYVVDETSKDFRKLSFWGSKHFKEKIHENVV